MTDREPTPEFEAMLDYLRRTRGFDFTAYKRSSLMRRILKRMQLVGLQDFTEYLDYLEVHPEEFASLFNTILINVTGFFRDAPAWEFLAAEILPRIVESRKGNASIRVWSAGCASGEETYTLAMVLAETLGADQFRRRVKLYATDVDDEALTQARQATYRAKDVEEIPPPLLEKYFERSGTQYTFHKNLRRSVIFGRHDLVQDAPISRVNLLVCRNTLMYFNSETQARILARFHFALHNGGCLFLGKAEMLLTHTHIFAPVDLKQRIFVKVQPHEMRRRLPRVADVGREEVANHMTDARIGELAFENDPVAQLIVEQGGLLVLANERARLLFGLSFGDLGRPIQDLEVFHKPTDLRSLIEQASTELRPVLLKDIQWPAPTGETRHMDVQTQPLLGENSTLLGIRVSFTDVTPYKRLQDELLQSKQDLETAYEELQSSNEELETTNEELQSSNEELETTNEELQSTNEELETMNEELQSTNEELETINTELRQRSEELNRANQFLASILGGLRAGVAVVDRDLRVLTWNERAEDLWGLRAQEVQGRNFVNLDIGLPTSDLLQPIRACVAGGSPYNQVILAATNRRGRAIQCAVTVTPLFGDGAEILGAILLMESREE